MQTDNLETDTISEATQKALEKSLRPISVAEMKKLGEGLFPFDDHPWRHKFLEFITENSSCTFHHAVTEDHVQVIYCGEKEKGMWFIPGRGVGLLQERGLRILKAFVAGGQ
jgi:hypothetical protein